MADHETVFGLDLGRTMRFVATQPCVSSRSLDVTFHSPFHVELPTAVLLVHISRLPPSHFITALMPNALNDFYL